MPDKWRAEALKLYKLMDMDRLRKDPELQALTLIASEVETIVAIEPAGLIGSELSTGAEIQGGSDILTKDEVHELINLAFPESSQEDRTRLTFTLGWYGPAVRQACSFIAHSQDPESKLAGS